MRVLRVPCISPEAAIDAKMALRRQEVDVTGVDDRYLLVPAGHSPLFPWGLAAQLQQWGYGEDAELSAWAQDACARPA